MVILRRFEAAVIVARATSSPFERPDRLPRALLALAPWGTTTAGAVASAAARYPSKVAIRDERGDTTYAELWRRARSIAKGLQDRGIGRGTRVGLLARNHSGFVESLVAVMASGADLVLLNTGFAGPQLADVVSAERIDVVIHDDEYTTIVRECGASITIDESALDALATAGGSIAPSRRQGSMVILTSGTTGRPKGAARSGEGQSPEGLAALLTAVPFRLGDVQVVPAPLFHGWGLSNLLLGLGRCATTVLARRFDAAATLRAVSDNDARVLVVVPVMLRRMLDLPVDQLLDAPTPALQVIASSGSALGSRLASDVLARFGPVLYNLYGSTEVAIATIAGPRELLRDPGTAGRVAFGVRVEIVDPDGRRVDRGERGRVFVGGSMKFEGYTNGTSKEVIRGLVSTGDLGYFRDGMLFIDGREDDMIVSGGENVYPIEVEELLQHHPRLADAAVVGVPDEEFGQVLAAFVVKAPGARIGDEEIRAHVKERLARHKVPRHIAFVDELPRNPTGKVLRRALAERITTGGRA